MAQKVGEEGLELALASVGQSDAEVVGEAADLLYHLLLLLQARQLSLPQSSRSSQHGMKASEEICQSVVQKRARALLLYAGGRLERTLSRGARQELGGRQEPSRAIRQRRSVSSTCARRIPAANISCRCASATRTKRMRTAASPPG